MKRGIILLSLLVIVLISLAASVYFLYLNVITCTNQACFNQALTTCRASYFTNDGADTVIQYKILGEQDNTCEIEVTLLHIKTGAAKITDLQGTSMICNTQYGAIVVPEKDLKYCHGLMKERIQEIIIKRMHSQIVQNIGKISEETTKII